MEFYGDAPDVDLTYSDVFLVPRRSDIASRLDVDLSPGDGTAATIPLVSANMNSVTGARLAATLARRGGLGVLPQDLPLQELDAAIRWVKAQPVPWDTPLVLPPDATVADASRLLPATEGHGIVVSHVASGRIGADDILGVVPATRLGTALPDARLGDLARGRAASIDAVDIESTRHAFDVIVAADAETVCVLDHGHLVGTLSRRSALRSTLYRPAVDPSGRLIVAAAVGINGDVAAKARALAAAGVDVLVVDTAHGHQEGMLRALRAVADLGLGIPIAAGNVVTADGRARPGRRGRRHPQGGSGARRHVHHAHDDRCRAARSSPPSSRPRRLRASWVRTCGRTAACATPATSRSRWPRARHPS